MPVPETKERVLSTLNADGSRRKLRPRLARGAFHWKRLPLGWGLIALFVACPLLQVGGKPAILLDLGRRQFSFFGRTMLATDTVVLMLLLVTLVVAVFLATALFGRVWCGWACPQTVYMELVYRPLERLLEGTRAAKRGSVLPAITKHALFLALSFALAHVFLAYFVPWSELSGWLTRSPLEHPGAFLTMLATAALVHFDFALFREQTCLLACPYGRLQAVLLDRQSWIIGYDARRGEPRGKRRAGGSALGAPRTRAEASLEDPRGDRAEERGHCIDCGLCARVCPTGIDIRDGLQMECVGCTQCIDACDSVMRKVGHPPRLIRYTSQDELAGKPRRLLRPRVVVYPLILIAAVTGFGIALGRSARSAEVTVLRGIGSPYALLAGGAEVSNQLRVKIVNRTSARRRYRIAIAEAGVRLVAPENPVSIRGERSATATAFVIAPRARFVQGRLAVTLRVSDGEGFEQVIPYGLLGPAGTRRAP